MSSILRYGFATVLVATTLVSAQEWQPHDTLTTLEFPGMTYDAGRERVVLAGLVDSVLQTWEYDGRDWVRRYSRTIPIVDGEFGITYDTVHHVVVLHTAEYTGVANTWTWDGVDWTLRGVGPNLLEHALAFDPVSQRTILFGGIPLGTLTPRNETWAWDGMVWTQLHPTQSPPAARAHGMAADTFRSRLVTVTPGNPSGGTWEWDGSNWSMVGTGTTLTAFELAYDTFRRRTVMLPAVYHPQPTPLSLYTWDGATWTEVLSQPGPGARTRTSWTYHPPSARLLLFGGFTNVVATTVRANGVTWAYDGRVWSQAVPEAIETTAVETSLAYDVVTQRVLGLMHGSFTPTQELLEWTGRRWNYVTNTPFPGQGKLVPDAARGTTLVVIPDATELATWEWDGTTFQQLAVSGPGPRERYALASDSRNGRVLLHGGLDGGVATDETWEWNGTAWRRIGRGPTDRYLHAMAHDPVRDVLVCFGGLDANGRDLGDTWEWDGQRWRSLNPPQSPSARSRHAMAYDPVLQRVVLIGGIGGVNALPDTWTWDGQTWTPLLDLPEARVGIGTFGAAFDASQQRLVVMTRAANSAVQTFEWTTTPPAGAFHEGTPCTEGSGAFMTEIAAFGRPELGRFGFGLDLVSSGGPSSAVMAFSLGSGNVPLGSCALLLDPARWIATIPLVTNGAGFAHLPMPLPFLTWNVPPTYVQGIAIDPVGTALGFSSRLRLQLGE